MGTFASSNSQVIVRSCNSPSYIPLVIEQADKVNVTETNARLSYPGQILLPKAYGARVRGPRLRRRTLARVHSQFNVRSDAIGAGTAGRTPETGSGWRLMRLGGDSRPEVDRPAQRPFRCRPAVQLVT
jgi:hypothetical protein